MGEESPLLAINDLKTHFPVTKGFLQRERGRVRAVDGISLELGEGEILGIVGESGSGKSTVARTIMGLETPTEGHIEFDGTRTEEMDAKQSKTFRRRVQMVFQDTDSSFDPRMTVGDAVQEPMIAHGLTDQSTLGERTEALLEAVDLSGEFSDRYPHELSGGEKQRAALARALALGPDVLVLDEPVSALDVSVQARIIELVKRLQREFGLSIILITHDMAVVKEICSRVAVMYLGEIVELAPTTQLFEDPKHPYSQALVAAIPEPDPSQRDPEMELKGSIPDPIDPPPGCRFHPRCPKVIQPQDSELAQETYRSIVDLRVALREGTFSLDSVQQRTGPRGSIEQTGPAGTSARSDPDSTANTIRAEYAIPGTLGDPQAETVLAEALERIIAGDIDRAQDVLDEEFGSICERTSPKPPAVYNGHVACHLHQEPVTDRSTPSDTD